jgi:hypothetical protein
MRKILIIVVTISLGLFMLFSLSSCGAGEKAAEKIIEKAIEEESGGEVDITGETVTIKTDEGESVIGIGAELPEGFPADVPVYPDMTITSSSKTSMDNKETFSFTADASVPGDEVVSWYKSELTGWNIDSEFTAESEGEETTMISATKGSYYLYLWIGDTDEGTSILLTVEKS